MIDPVLLAAWRIRDTAAEDAVLCGVIRWPALTLPALRVLDFTAADFSRHKCGVLFNAACYVAAAVAGRACLGDVYARVKKLNQLEDLGGRREFAPWLLDIWDNHHWPDDIAQWWDEEYDDKPSQVGMAGAMAKKVKHLAARREAIHKANERMRDAVDGVFSTDTYEEG